MAGKLKKKGMSKTVRSGRAGVRSPGEKRSTKKAAGKKFWRG